MAPTRKTTTKTTEAPVEEVTEAPAEETAPDETPTPQVPEKSEAAEDLRPGTNEALSEPAEDLRPGTNHAESAGSRDDSVVVKATDMIEGVTKEAAAGEAFVELTKDVVEEFYYPNTRTPAQRILFTKGQVVPKAQIDALNANVSKAREASSDEVAIEDYVDASTLSYINGEGDTNVDSVGNPHPDDVAVADAK